MLITLFLKVAWPEVVYSLSKMYTKRNVKTTTCGFRGTSVQTTALWLFQVFVIKKLAGLVPSVRAIAGDPAQK